MTEAADRFAQGRCVLVAEDDHELRRLVATTLREAGFTVVECPHGLDLVDRLATHLESGGRLDLVVSDVRMPGVTGLSVLEGLAEWDELRDLRVVLMSAFADAQLHDQARRFGALAVLEKPFEMSALLQTVRAVFEGTPPAGAPDAS